MTGNIIRVFLLVQSQLLREGLKRLLKKEVDIRVIGVSPLDSSIRRRTIDLSSDILVVESGMLSDRDSRGNWLFSELKQAKLVVIDMGPDNYDYEPCVQACLAGYVSGDAPASKLVEVIRNSKR